MILQADIPKGLNVHSHADILTHSVLANLVSNAIKFSPKGSSIQLMARHEGKRVRIQLFNPGTSIPEAVLNAFRSGDDYHSSMGTEGEAGMGHGLRIVSATLQQLQGYFSIRNDVHGVCMDLEVPSSEI
jgi:signal transduction histidine kinase